MFVRMHILSLTVSVSEKQCIELSRFICQATRKVFTFIIFPSSSWSCQCPCGCGTVVKRYIIFIIMYTYFQIKESNDKNIWCWIFLLRNLTDSKLWWLQFRSSWCGAANRRPPQSSLPQLSHNISCWFHYWFHNLPGFNCTNHSCGKIFELGMHF